MTTTTEASAWNLPAGQPIVLLPVRLETRWRSDTLAIRVIPDTIHIDTFEAGLTADEADAGQWFWSLQGAPGGQPDAAWLQLCDLFGPPRAAWIARLSRAGTPAATRTSSWSRPPQAAALPTRWIALARTGDEVMRAVGAPLSAGSLSAGIGPAADGTGSTPLPGWMTDFTAAIDAGLGLELPLGPITQAQRKLDLLLVYGVTESGDPAAGAAQLTSLLDSHYYTDGVTYLAPGTPTNNTAGTPSAYMPSSPDYLAAYRVQAADTVPAGADTCACRLAAALGLPLADTGAHAIALAAGASEADESIARAMNTALYAATWGYFLGQMLVEDEGEDARRLDHRNVAADDAYLRSLDRQRLWPTAQRGVITSVTGTDPGVPGTDAFAAGWQAAIAVRENAGASAADAVAGLEQDVNDALRQLWHGLHEDYGSPLDDWLAATANLTTDRTARFAYYRWMARSRLGGPAVDLRLEDWLAGDTAARYGDGTVRAVREHFTAYVRPGGHLSTLGIGRQPYGMLITTSLDRWQPGPGEADLRPAVAALRALRDTVWLPAAAALPRLGSAPLDADGANSALFDIMGAAPVSAQIFGRVQLGPDYARNLWRFTQTTLRLDWEAVTGSSSGQLLHDVGIAWNPRASRLIGAEAPALLSAAMVTDSQTATSAWLQFLADPATSIAALVAAADLSGADTPVLYRLLRHSALREYADSAIRVLAERGALSDWEHLDVELIGILPATPAQTLWSQLGTRGVATDAGEVPLAGYLESVPADDPGVAGISQFRTAVTDLAQADDDTLARHLLQTLDTTSHRLDAWITSIAARRLASQRAASPSGILLGGYGWVTDLQAADAQPADTGFVHAPSVPQAVTAAVLRSGYDAHVGGAANPFAIDLSSARVRLATALLDAVRAGQAPGAAIGYLFERTLQSTLAGQYVPDFRDLAPTLVTSVNPAAQTSVSASLAVGVTDGLVLAGMAADNDAALLALLARIRADDAALPAGEPPLLPVVTAALDALADVADATADALLAESVHHTVNGSPTRAAATLDALASGAGSVPELEIARTPRTGTALTHRVALLLGADAPTQPHWPQAAASPRAAASPALEVLLQQLLPDPTAVMVPATVSPAGAAPVTVTVTLADAALSAVDCVLSVSAAPADGADGPSDLLAAALARAARLATGTSAALPPVSLDLAPPADGTGLRDFIELCRLLADLAGRSRPLLDTDLAAPGAAGAAAADLTGRAAAASAAVDAAAAQLGSADESTVRLGLQAAAQLGVAGAATAGDAPQIDASAAGSVAAELAARRRAIAALDGGQALARIQAALGADLPVLSSVSAPDPAGLAAARTAADSTGFADAPTVRGWVAAAATVREAVASLRRLVTGRLALRLDGHPYRTVQFPAPTAAGVPTEPWIGAAFGGRVIAGPRTQITFVEAAPTDFTAPVAGLLVDEWSESVPARTAVTGLAYRYPSPSSQPPQAILIAVSPDATATSWDGTTIEQVLLETIDMASIRAVDPDSLRDTGQLLPAAYLAYNAADPPDAVSTQPLSPP